MKVSKFMRKLFSKADERDRSLQLRLRKAVTLGKARHVTALLEEGASPIWMEDEEHSHRRFRRRDPAPCQLNALLLTCQSGNVEMLNLMLDAFLKEPQVLAHFGRAMYCLVIRHDHWKAFKQLQQRQVPMNSMSSRKSSDSSESPRSITSSQPLSITAMDHSSSNLPMPIFVAAEHGRPQILSYMLDHYPSDWAGYTFDGYSLLTAASINGNYECVRVLLERQVTTERSLDAAVAAARRHRQAHVLVLLTSYLPEFVSDPEPVYKSWSGNGSNDLMYPQMQWSNEVMRFRGRSSVAETVSSEFDDEDRRSSFVNISSPINYSQDMDRAEEMLVRAEMGREQRQVGMMWFLDRCEPGREMQRHMDYYGSNEESFGGRKSAQDDQNDSFLHEDDEAWYAVKSNDESREQHDDLLESDEEEVENSYESMFDTHEDDVNNTFDDMSPLSEEYRKPNTAPRPSSIAPSGTSRKLISVRSRGFQPNLLAAIEENPAGEAEA